MGNPLFSSILKGTSYKYMIIFFSVLIALSLSTIFLNMFYESKDTLALLPLPINDRELFFSKFLVLIFQMAGLLLPIFIINYVVALQDSFSLIKVIVVLIYSLSLAVIIVGGLMILLSFITYIPNFEKNKNKINGIIIVVGLLLGVGYFIASTELLSSNRKILTSSYEGDFLYNILINDISHSYINLSILIATSLIIIFLVNRLIAKKYLSDIHRISNGTIKKASEKKINNKRNSEKYNSLNIKLIKRNIRLFSHGTLIATAFSNNLFGLVFLTGAIVQIRRSEGFYLGSEFYPVAICFGFSMALLMMSNPINFSGVAISLEQQSYYQLKSLPLDFKKYLRIKLIISTFFQVSLALVIFIATLIFAKQSAGFIVITIISFILTGIAISLYSFARDFNNLYLN
ncbi:hypothetical protein ACWOBT_06370 [Gemella cuniculi]